MVGSDPALGETEGKEVVQHGHNGLALDAPPHSWPEPPELLVHEEKGIELRAMNRAAVATIAWVRASKPGVDAALHNRRGETVVAAVEDAAHQVLPALEELEGG